MVGSLCGKVVYHIKFQKEELAWAAGFFDGEGWVGVNKYSPQISISQTDIFVLERFKAAIGGFGSLSGPYISKNIRWNALWKYNVYGFEKVQSVFAILHSYLSPIKKAQFTKVLCLVGKPVVKQPPC